VEFPTALPQTGHFALLNNGCYLVASVWFAGLVVEHYSRLFLQNWHVREFWDNIPKDSCLTWGFRPNILARTGRRRQVVHRVQATGEAEATRFWFEKN
jgi:hypothetical protein